jgi:hypothetical protein
MTPHHISDVILTSQTPMDWTCVQHIRHGKLCLGYAKLPKVHGRAQYENTTSNLLQ